MAVVLATLMLMVGSTYAHVSVQPSRALTAAYGSATFNLGHGCKGNATLSVEFQIPPSFIATKAR
jgi:uncharacterized protein YcnI